MPNADERFGRTLRSISPPGDPSGVFEEVARRRMRYRWGRRVLTASAILSIALVVGGGAFFLLDAPRAERERAWTGLWPHDDREDAIRAQEAVDAGQTGSAWQADARRVLVRFARNELGWTGVTFLDARTERELAGFIHVSGLEGAGSGRVGLSECPFADRLQGCRGALVSVDRLVRPAPGGVWEIVAYRELLLPPLAWASEREVLRFVDGFMGRRMRGEGAEPYLSLKGREAYLGAGDLGLYGGYTGFDLLGVDRRAADRFEVTVRMHLAAADFRERLTVRALLSGKRSDELSITAAHLVG
jgi:hypothetical protein